ncbi:MAG: Zn-ribbon domain-containing OB-fold protein [Actinomycetota bacterium]|jgi:uncharacterized OB-fold protein|nr:Zn-ribbon domain-containing OB-fold protein [Actinomycetota bacterium]
MSGRLAPSMTPDTAFFWEGVRDHRLLIQRCTECGTLRHPPRPMCPRCTSLSWEAIEASGRGTVLSFVMPRHPQFPGFDERFIVALVELEEGTRLVSNLVGTTPEEASIGMAVEVRFEHFDNDVVLPQFVPAGGGPGGAAGAAPDPGTGADR